MSAAALFWGWARGGRRWHLRPEGADLALCGVGKCGWKLVGDPFDRDADDIYVTACGPCLGIARAAVAEAGEG